MANNNNKMRNLYYGLTLPVMIDGQECDFTEVSNNLEKYFLGLSQNSDAISVTKKAMKEAGLLNVSELLDRVYWVFIELVNTPGKPEKDSLEKAIIEAGKLFQWVTGKNNCVLWAQQYDLVLSALAVQAVGGKNACIGNMKVTSVATFKKSFLNALYNAFINERNFTLTDRQEKAKEKAFASAPVKATKIKTRKPQKGLQIEKTEKGLPNHA